MAQSSVNIKEQLKKLNKETNLLRTKGVKDAKPKPSSAKTQQPKSALVQPGTQPKPAVALV